MLYHNVLKGKLVLGHDFNNWGQNALNLLHILSVSSSGKNMIFRAIQLSLH